MDAFTGSCLRFIQFYFITDVLRGQQLVQTQFGDKHDRVDTRSIRDCTVLYWELRRTVVSWYRLSLQHKSAHRHNIPHMRDSLDTYLFSSERLLIDT